MSELISYFLLGDQEFCRDTKNASVKLFAAEYISGSDPLKEKLPAIFRNEEKSGESFREQEKMMDRLALVCDHGSGNESALRRGRRDCFAMSGN